MRRAYTIYLVSGTAVCAGVALGAIVTGEYMWIGVGVGGAVSCFWSFLRRRRAREYVLPNKSAIARWREEKEHRTL